MEQVVDGGNKLYIAKRLYSRHQKGHVYLRDTELLIRALSGSSFTNFITMHPIQNTVGILYIYDEVRKSKALQQRLRTTDPTNMENSRETPMTYVFPCLAMI